MTPRIESPCRLHAVRNRRKPDSIWLFTLRSKSSIGIACQST
jgi:hypothetical protein